MKNNNNPKRKYEFKKDKIWKKIRRIGAIGLAFVLIIVGSIMLIKDQASNKPVENKTIKAQIDANDYKEGKIVENAEVFMIYSDGEIENENVQLEKDTEVDVDINQIETIDNIEYIYIGYEYEDEIEFGYVEKSKIIIWDGDEFIDSDEEEINNNQEENTIDSNQETDQLDDKEADVKADDDEVTDQVTPQNETKPLYTKITLNNNKVTLKVGQIYSLKATATPSNVDDTITWSSSRANVASVSSNGVVTTKSIGTTVITATNSDKTVSSECVITVKAKEVAVTSLSITKKDISLSPGKTYTISYKINPSNATNKKVTFRSSNTDVATVSAKGVITAKKEGNASIIVVTASGKKTQIIKVKIVKSAVKSTVTKPKCVISSISSNYNVLHYTVSCNKGVSIKTTKYKIANGSFIERDKTKIKDTKSDIIFKTSRVGKKITLRVYYGNGNDYSEKSIVLGNNTTKKSTTNKTAPTKKTNTSSSNNKNSSKKTPYCKTGYLNSNKTKCVKKTGVSTKSTCGSYIYNNGKCYKKEYVCVYGGKISQAMATPTCICGTKKTNYCKTKYGSYYGYKATGYRLVLVSKQPTRTYYCTNGTKKGTGSNAYCEVVIGNPSYK